MRTILIEKENYCKNKKYYDNLIFHFHKDNGEDVDWSRSSIEDMILNRDVFYSAVLIDGKIVSLCRYAKIWYTKTYYTVRQISTLKEFQGKGLGSACLKVGDEYIKSRGGRKLISMIADDNISSIKMHEKCGFKKGEPNKTFKKSFYYFENSCFYEKDFEKEV